MKIIIMNCDNKHFWYSNKIGKTYKVQELSCPSRDYITKAGIVKKNDAQVIES